ncbi:hypothetical protein GCM10009839_17860 [Catenulispora yoronensis]|uniref:Uncharacterized protein n=1 Tax=Catenulispora yoronensis TaxID=450799 RepID=A0ABN2TVU1_9ACTN
MSYPDGTAYGLGWVSRAPTSRQPFVPYWKAANGAVGSCATAGLATPTVMPPQAMTSACLIANATPRLDSR